MRSRLHRQTSIRAEAVFFYLSLPAPLVWSHSALMFVVTLKWILHQFIFTGCIICMFLPSFVNWTVFGCFLIFSSVLFLYFIHSSAWCQSSFLLHFLSPYLYMLNCWIYLITLHFPVYEKSSNSIPLFFFLNMNKSFGRKSDSNKQLMQHYVVFLPSHLNSLSFTEFRVCQKSFHIFLPVLLHWEGEVEQLVSHPRGFCLDAVWPTTHKHKSLSAKTDTVSYH